MRALHFLLLPQILLALGGLAHSAPSTILETEIQLPLEGITGFALIDQPTGQMRIVSVDGTNTATTAPPVLSGLPDVTGATSGFNAGGDESIVLASTTANRLALVNMASGNASPLFTPEQGPTHPAYLRRNGAAPQDLHIAHSLTTGGDTLTLYRDPTGAHTMLDDITGFDPIPSLQSFFDTPVGARYAIGVANNGASTRLFSTFVDVSNNIDGGFADMVPEDTLIASNVRRSDALLMAVGYVRGSKDLSLIPISAPPTLDPAVAVNVPFPVGSVAPARGGIDGFLVTALDGSEASHYRITAANVLSLVQSFTPSGGNPIHGLVPVPGRGIMLLTGKPNLPSSDFEFHIWDGGGWGIKDSGQLPPLAPVVPLSFATLFWFSSEPLVNTDALLIDMVANPDWTSKSDPNPIPAKIFTETYGGTGAGLDNPVSTLPSPPPGANHLVTNQFIDSISLSALDDVLALTLPSLSVSPPSGSYTSTVSVTAFYDEDSTEVFYREDEFGAPWLPYTEILSISYAATLQFYARDIGSGTPGPIITRTYSFAPGDLGTFDSDGDGVPDFVEVENDLDPDGGADTDKDGVTDLDELIDGSDPNDPTDTPAMPISPFTGEGFRILAQANNTTTGEGSNGLPEDPTLPATLTDGEPIDLHGVTSNLLGSASVIELTDPASLAGELAADLNIGTPVAEGEWLILNSPQFFDLDGPAPETRGGREIYKVIQRPIQIPPTIAPVLSGVDQSADAAVWIAAADAAYTGYEQVSTITDLNPIDTAHAVVCEAAIYDALLALSLVDPVSLGVPQDIAADPGPPALDAIPGYRQFTLFGNRDGDSDRTSLSDPMREALIAEGLSFENLYVALELAISGSPSLTTLTNALYNYHVAHSEPTAPEADVIPLLPLPLDVLRELARGGDLPADYVGVVTAATVNVAKTELTNALATLNTAYRPTDTWTIEVTAPVVTGEDYAYINLDSTNPVAFYKPNGLPMKIEQGLGLAIGMRYSVTGYTDVTGPPGHDAMEPTNLTVMFVPSASDNDGDGNLLDDEWEEFFFGATGVKSPFDTHPVNGYTYLQLFLIGHDPRDECTELPTEPMIDLAPNDIELIRLPSENLAIKFTFPDAFISHFTFTAAQTETLTGFAPFATGALANPSTNTYHLDLGPSASLPVQNFFQLLMSLN